MNRKEHLVTCVAEEANEIAIAAHNISHAAHKALRFGLNSNYMTPKVTNLDDIVREVNDLIGTLELLQEAGVEMPMLYDRAAIDAKKARIDLLMPASHNVLPMTSMDVVTHCLRGGHLTSPIEPLEKA